MGMTSEYPRGHPFGTFFTPPFPSSSSAAATEGAFVLNGAHMNQFQSHSSSSESSQRFGHGTKRTFDTAIENVQEEGEPKAKRKVARMNAHFRNFHISPVESSGHEAWCSRQKAETFQEIEDRLSDSSEEDMVEDDEVHINSPEGSAESDPKKVHLSEMLREYINRVRDQPVIPQSPSSMALVPYVPRNPLEDSTMRGRINEISLEEAERIAGSSVSGSESVPYVEHFTEEFQDEESSASQSSSPLSIVELPDDSEFDMDVDFE